MSKEKVSKEHNFRSEDIILRLQEVTKSKTISALAERLGTQQAVISNWKRKNTIPWGLVFEHFDSVTAVYILTGEKIYPKEIETQEPRALQTEAHAPQPDSDTESLRRQIARLEGALDHCRETNAALLAQLGELAKADGTPSRETATH